MNSVPKSALAAETPTRVLNDGQLAAAGWVVEDTRNLNLSIAQHVARREAIMATGHGRADYLLYLDRRVVGMIEAKPVGTPLSGVGLQLGMSIQGLPAEVRLIVVTGSDALPYVFEASGTETRTTNGYDPEPRSRRLFADHGLLHPRAIEEARRVSLRIELIDGKRLAELMLRRGVGVQAKTTSCTTWTRTSSRSFESGSALDPPVFIDDPELRLNRASSRPYAMPGLLEAFDGLSDSHAAV